MKLNQLKNKSLLILGLAREGWDTFLFLRKIFPEQKLALADQLEFEQLPKNFQKILKKDEKIKLYLGKNYLESLKKHDIIIKTPGIPLKILSPWMTKKQVITSQTEIFFENHQGTIVGVAGTKGKSTTATLIYKILKKGGKKVYLIGNIGKPALSLLFKTKPDDIYIYELSSYQLQYLKKSPKIALLLNTYPDHLDYHQSFNEYLKSNANITRHQTSKDLLIYNSQDKLAEEIAKKSKAKKMPIQGKYYSLNIVAAKKVGKILKISDKIILRAIKEFKPLPHRLEFIGEFKGIKFYNDSLSVIPETTEAAMKILGKGVQTIILGGFERNLDFRKLAQKIVRSQIKTVILFPVTGERIWQALRLAWLARGKKLAKHFFVDNMKKAVKIAYENTEKGKICLLSPASASFGLFKDYRQRGNQFKKAVKNLKSRT